MTTDIEQQIHVSSYESHVVVFWQGEKVNHRGTVQADRLNKEPEDMWWIARALVQPALERGKGIGGQLLERLKQEVTAQGCQKLIVAPGGYDMDKDRQERFYMHHGFIRERHEDADGWVLVWRPS